MKEDLSSPSPFPLPFFFSLLFVFLFSFILSSSTAPLGGFFFSSPSFPLSQSLFSASLSFFSFPIHKNHNDEQINKVQ